MKINALKFAQIEEDELAQDWENKLNIGEVR